jgi:hypothetical protein
LCLLQLLRLLLHHGLLQLLLLHVLIIIFLAEQVEPQTKVWAGLMQYTTTILAMLAALVPATALMLAALLPLPLLQRLSSRTLHCRRLQGMPFRLHPDRPARS